MRVCNNKKTIFARNRCIGKKSDCDFCCANGCNKKDEQRAQQQMEQGQAAATGQAIQPQMEPPNAAAAPNGPTSAAVDPAPAVEPINPMQAQPM